MDAVKYLALALAGLAAALLARLLLDESGARWTRAVDAYGAWVADELDKVLIVVTPVRASLWVTVTVLAGVGLGVLAGSGMGPRIFWAVVLGVAGYFVPTFAVRWLQARYLERVDDQLADALRMMANALKAGLNLQQALDLVSREMPPPIGTVFGRVVNEIGLGRLTDDALRRMAGRVPLEDIRLFTDSVLTLRETGGNLSETFAVIAETVVERKKVQGRIKTVTTQGVSQGVIICAMPIALMLMFSVIDENYLAPFFTTPLGWVMLAAVFILDAVGMWAILKLVKVEV
ncbi:MAG: type II secretion system F family protein [Vicinamibacterales bacterium]